MEDTKELYCALVAAQSQMPSVKKTNNNPFFKSKYADLATIMEAAWPVLAANDLAVIQAPTEITGNVVSIITRIVHKSGQNIQFFTHMPVDKMSPQAVGSAISYARRYSLAAILGIPQDDDDANAATNNVKVEPKVESKVGPKQCCANEVNVILNTCATKEEAQQKMKDLLAKNPEPGLKEYAIKQFREKGWL